MTKHCDLLIRHGTIVDGSGERPYRGDVAVMGDRIVAIGSAAADYTAEREIDATDRLVTPGFVGIHADYDGQITWENRLIPSSNHGVTTVIMGNCGVGFAPTKADDRSRHLTIKLMEGVEDIPEVTDARIGGT